MLGRLEEAAVMMQQAVDMARRTLRENHPETGRSSVIFDVIATVMNVLPASLQATECAISPVFTAR